MPTYEYVCLTCGKTFSVVQRIRDDKLTVHEGCGGALERLISGGRLLLPKKSAAPDSGDDFPDTPGAWDDDPYGAMDPMGAMGGMGGMGGIGGMGGMDDLGGGFDDYGGDDFGDDGFDDGADDDF